MSSDLSKREFQNFKLEMSGSAPALDPDPGGGSNESYAGASARVTSRMMNLMFQRTDPTVSYNLTDYDIARTCHQIMGIPPG